MSSGVSPMPVTTARSRSATAHRVAERDGRAAALLGAALIVLGLAVNPWTVADVFSPDGVIQSRLILLAILSVEAVLIAVGAWLLVRRPRISRGDVIGSAIAWLLFLAGAEGLLRLAYGHNDFWFATLQRSPDRGWETRGDFRIVRDMGPYGVVTYTTGPLGMRRTGDPASDRPRLLVLGDSYTEAVQVSDGDAYYDALAEFADVEVFAYGASAYGSLQEYQALDRLIDVVQPDLIIWQFCSNDLINNYRPLEARSLFENSWWRRPYLEDGAIRVRAPSMNPLTQVSRIAQLIESRRAMVRAAQVASGRSDERSIESMLHAEHPLLRESTQVTEQILRLVAARADSVPVVAFAVDRPAWLGDTFERLSASAGFRFVDDVPEAIAAHRAAGISVDGGEDAHWNAIGHRIAGRMLADSLIAWSLVAPRGDTLATVGAH